MGRTDKVRVKGICPSRESHKKAGQQESSEGGVNMNVDDEAQKKAPQNLREPEGQAGFHHKDYHGFCALRMLKIPVVSSRFLSMVPRRIYSKD